MFKWPARAVLWMSDRAAQWPVVGPYARPMGSALAIGLWGARQAASVFAAIRRPATTEPGEPALPPPEASEVCASALRETLAAGADMAWPAPQWLPPVAEIRHQRRRHLYASAVPYGAESGQLLDVWRNSEVPATPAPVLIFVPGGAWLHGSRKYQGHALMSHMCERGWVCLAVDYRVSPTHRWPRHVRDVKAAIAWARANVGDFGGDSRFVAICGASAGGHLAALAGLTPGDPEFDVELDDAADTTVDAVVSLYGRYDWEDRSTPERRWFVDFLETLVMQRNYAKHRPLFRAASPLARITAAAPPFLIVHGSADSVIPVDQARSFVTALKARSRDTVVYVELPGAQHAFDLIDGSRSGAACETVGRFLCAVRARSAAQHSADHH